MSNYESRHPNDMVLHPLSEIREWDEALTVLGIQDSHVTPAEAVRERISEIERLDALLRKADDALVQARGALVLDAMVDQAGKPYGTTAVAIDAINEARAEIELYHTPASTNSDAKAE